jgi:hypothetical protein
MLLKDRRKPVVRDRVIPMHSRIAIVVVLCVVAFLYWRLMR